MLLLGTGQHGPDSGLPGVPAVSSTVADLKRALVDRCGLPETAVTTCVDAGSVEQMGEAVAQAAAEATDLLVVFYVGHGVVSSEGRLHLATAATRTARDAVRYTALPYTEVALRVRDSRAAYRVVILDCCESGRALDWAGVLGEPDELADQSQVPGGFVLTSSGRYEVSLAPEGARHTAFTGALIRLLRDGDPDAGPMLTLDAVRRYSVSVARCRGLPEPRCRADGDLGQLEVAPNPSFHPSGPVPLRARAGTGGSVSAGTCPYLGLAPFDVADVRWFHGRERLTMQLVRAVAERYHVLARPLVVIGASGAGKSSLLRAGLIPALDRGELQVAGSAGWPVRVLNPGDRPLAALAASVVSLAGGSIEQVVARLSADPAAIVDLLGCVVPGRSDGTGRVVLIIDQFEELFTLRDADRPGAEPAGHEAFVDALVAAAATSVRGAPVALVVLGMRADFYGHCAGYASLAAVLADTPVLVGAMTDAEVREAIERPARDVGLDLDDDLVDALRADLGAGTRQPGRGYEPGRLPLLSHALRATWQRQDNGRLTLAGYHATGRIAGALAVTADAVMTDIADRFGAAGRRIAEQILTRLVHVANGTDPARLRLSRRRLLAGLPLPDAGRVLDALASENARIITTGAPNRTEAHDSGTPGDSIEIVHDALLREWDLLCDLLDRDRAALLVEGDLRAAAAQWHTRGQAAGALYQGDDLAVARRWAMEPGHHTRLDPDTQAFLAASIGHEQSRRRRRVVLIGLLIIALVGAGSAVWQRRQAESAQTVAQSRQLAAQAENLFATNPDLASLLAMQSYRIAPTSEAGHSLAAAGAQPLRSILTGHTDGVRSVVFSPDGTRLATASRDKTAKVWNARSGRLVTTLTGHRGIVWSVVFSPDGSRLATASDDGTARLWDARTGENLAILARHTSFVWSVVFSPDGSRLATAGNDKTAKVWDARGGRLLTTLTGHTSRAVWSVVFSPDGARVATAGGDKTARVWDARSGERLRTLAGHIDGVKSVVFSSDGARLATASFDTTAKLWDARSGKLLTTLTGHIGTAVRSVVFSPDGARVATAGGDKTAKVWDARTGRLLTTLIGHTGTTVRSVVFSPDGARVATASNDTTAKVWDTRSGKLLATLAGHTAGVSSVVFSPDGSLLATASDDRGDSTARVWDTRSGGLLATLAGHVGGVRSVVFSPDGARVASAGDDRAARVWDARSGKLLTKLAGHVGRVWSVVFSPDGARVATAGDDNTARVWDARSGRPLTKLAGHVGRVWSVAFSPDGSRLASASHDTTAKVWDVRSGKVLTTLAGHTASVEAVVFSPDGTRLATASNEKTLGILGIDKTAKVWDARSGKLLITLTGHTAGVEAVVFSPDGARVATASYDTTAKVWDARSGKLLATLAGHTTGVDSVVFSPDGSRLATAGKDTTARVWDSRNGKLLTTLTGHAGGVWSVVFSPDGSRLATASDDTTARVWDTHSGGLLATLTGHSAGVWSVVFSPDGTRLATASNDKTVRTWNSPPGPRPMREICRAVNRNLSHQEWAHYLPGRRYEPVCETRR